MTTSTFLPARLDAARWDDLEPLFQALQQRPISSRADLEQWLLDRSALDAACSEAQAILYINMTCRTEDTAAQQAYADYIQTIPPQLKPASFELDKRFVELAVRLSLDSANPAAAPASGGRYTVMQRDLAADVSIFRPENVAVETELDLLAQKYEQIAGAMTVNYDGREQTMPQMARYQELTDRSVRESAWRAVSERRLKDKDAIDAVFDEMIKLRHQVARNAGFDNFVGYAFKAKHRFDYDPKACFAFHDAAQRSIVPVVRRIDEQRRRKLGVDKLRPWDLAVDPLGRGPLRPFNGGRELMSKSVAAFHRLDPRLADMLAALGDGSESRGADNGASLDLDSRKGKAPGGYQYMLEQSRRAFIFMNAAGLHSDVTTMLHEAGHAFHSTLCRDEPLVHYRNPPMEFAEVASMSMELLAMPYLAGSNGRTSANGASDTFYSDPADFARACRHQLERSIDVLPWIATIDAFQHWIYSNPTHTREQRTAQWLSLIDRFGHAIAWDGLEPQKQNMWQRQMHLFSHPFYYIEYGIAQLGALQLWLISLEQSPKVAVENYIRAMRLGGSKPLPDLFAAAGLTFDFGESTVKRLMDRVERELEKLPE